MKWLRLSIILFLLSLAGCLTAGVVVPLPRTQPTSESEFVPPFDVAWVRCFRPTQEPIEIYPFELSEPVHSGGSVVVGSRSGRVVCIDLTSGERKWEFETVGPVESTAAIDGGVVYIGDDSGYLYALSLKDGGELWRYRVPEGEIIGRVAAKAGYVAFSTDAHSLIMLTDTGEFLWMHMVDPPSSLNVRGAGSPLFYGDLVVAGFSDGTLRAFETQTGKPAWRVELKKQGEMRDVDSDPVLVDGVLYSAAYRGHLYAIDADSASILWRYPAGSIASAAIGAGKVFYATDSGTLIALAPKSGEKIWDIEIAKTDKRRAFVKTSFPSFATAPAYRNGYVVFGTSRGNLTVVEAESGEVRFKRYLSSSISARPLIVDNTVLVHTDQDCLYALVP